MPLHWSLPFPPPLPFWSRGLRRSALAIADLPLLYQTPVYLFVCQSQQSIGQHFEHGPEWNLGSTQPFLPDSVHGEVLSTLSRLPGRAGFSVSTLRSSRLPRRCPLRCLGGVLFVVQGEQASLVPGEVLSTPWRRPSSRRVRPGGQGERLSRLPAEVFSVSTLRSSRPSLDVHAEALFFSRSSRFSPSPSPGREGERATRGW